MNVLIVVVAWISFTFALVFTMTWIMQLIKFAMCAYHDREYTIGSQYVFVSAIFWAMFGFLITIITQQ